MKTIILAAGKSTRMHTTTNKLLHKILGKPMLAYIIDTALKINPKDNKIDIVIEKESEIPYFLKEYSSNKNINFVTLQKDENIFSAVSYVMEGAYKEGDSVLILFADIPFIKFETVNHLIDIHNLEKNCLTFIDKDTNSDFEDSKNTGIYLFEATALKFLLENLPEDCAFFDSKKILPLLEFMYKKVYSLTSADSEEFFNINTITDLAKATSIIKNYINYFHMENGVMVLDPSNTNIGPDVRIGKETIIHPNVTITGKSSLGENCVITSSTIIENTTIENFVEIEISVLKNSVVGSHSKIGPFAYLRPNSTIGTSCKVGDFVEIKNSSLGDNTKVSHLTYVGDSVVGSGVNFGCGTVTVNYDGNSKFQTVIEDNVFIGCNANLIAPVRLSKGSFIAAGSTITEDVPENSLSIARSRQTNKENWKRK